MREIYNPNDVKPGDRNTRVEIIRYLCLKGLKCIEVADDESNSPYIRENYYIMKPREELIKEFKKMGITLARKSEGKGYLPELKNALEKGIVMLNANVWDYEVEEEKYDISIKYVNKQEFYTTYDWIKDYAGFLYILEDLPTEMERRINVSRINTIFDGIDISHFDKSGRIYRIDNAYFDIGEYFDWVTG